LNNENDGNDGYIDENKAILLHDAIDQIWLSINDILNNNYDLILMDTNMHRRTTNSLLELLIQKDFPNPIVSTSDSPEQALDYWYEHVEKNKVTKNFKEYIIDPLKSGLFLKQRQESHSSRKSIIEEKKLINQQILQYISHSLKDIKIRYRIFWKIF
jgi:CheY-like chemotaxis protein